MVEPFYLPNEPFLCRLKKGQIPGCVKLHLTQHYSMGIEYSKLVVLVPVATDTGTALVYPF